MVKATGANAPSANRRHWVALIAGNVALALGPLWVRLADSGPVAAGFWRLALALPFLALFARWNRQPLLTLSRPAALAIGGAGIFFAFDLASWHIGIGMTRLGNASLFGNAGSILLVAWGLIILRRRPHGSELAAFAATVAGSAILLGRSLEIDHATLIGDLFCLLAGFLYTFYILLLQNVRAKLGQWSVLFWASVSGLPILLGTAILLGEPVLPSDWTPLIALALTSQVLGQGLLVYALRHFSPFVIGLALLTQPAVSVIAGWVGFGETLSVLDALGMALVGAGLVLAKLRQG